MLFLNTVFPIFTPVLSCTKSAIIDIKIIVHYGPSYGHFKPPLQVVLLLFSAYWLFWGSFGVRQQCILGKNVLGKILDLFLGIKDGTVNRTWGSREHIPPGKGSIEFSSVYGRVITQDVIIQFHLHLKRRADCSLFL